MNYLAMDIALFIAGYVASIFTWSYVKSFVVREQQVVKDDVAKVKAKIKSKI